MDASLVFSSIDRLNEQYVNVWEDVCNIESPSGFKAGVDAVSDYFIALSKKLNWNIERFPHEKFGDVVCVTMNPNAEKAPVALSGHMDTVHALGTFGTPAVRIEDGKIYGPGVCDCKGGIVGINFHIKFLIISPKRVIKRHQQSCRE